MNDLTERIDELEIRFTHQALLVDELNAEVLECHRRIDQLERENRRFGEMLSSLAPELSESPDE